MTEIMRQYADLQSNDSIMIKEYFKIDSGVGYIYCSLFGSERIVEFEISSYKIYQVNKLI